MNSEKEINKPVNKTYSQEWTEYNLAQTKEKVLFYKLLDELINIIPKREYNFGRPRKALRDMIFCCMIKTYTNTSSRRAISDLELAKKAGYIQDVPHFNTVLNYFDDSAMWIILEYLISISSLLLKQVENTFAVDSTGFGTKRFDRWVDVRNQFGKNVRMGYLKAHVCTGVKTNIVTSCQITDSKVGDSCMFTTLINKTNENFNMNEISADKAYSSRANMDLANKVGALPYIPFKSNVTGKSRGSPTWAKMYKLFTSDYEAFADHYHKRSNVESTFAMIKRKFGDFCRCKSIRSQTNEIMCKILAHNIVVLIHESFELGIEVDFLECAKIMLAQKVN